MNILDLLNPKEIVEHSYVELIKLNYVTYSPSPELVQSDLVMGSMKSFQILLVTR